MKVKVIGVIWNLEIEGGQDIFFEGCRITNNINFKNNKITKNFKNLFGDAASFLIKNSYIFYYEGDPSELLIPSYFQSNTLNKIAYNYNGYFQSIFSAFWFLKDDAISIPVTYVELLGSNNKGTHSFNTLPITKANGKDEPTMFTSSEIELALKIFSDIDNFYNQEDQISMMKKRLNHHANDPQLNRELKPYDLSRTSRAILFLRSIRFSDEPIVKITYHMAMYECLFLTSNQDVCENLKQRVSIFIGGSRKEKDSIQYYISQAYNIRSRYMHGDTVSLTVEEINKFSLKIDELTRTILRKILYMKDNHMFTRSETTTSKEEFDQYFVDMISNKTSPL
jgi:hypothetical protein